MPSGLPMVRKRSTGPAAVLQVPERVPGDDRAEAVGHEQDALAGRPGALAARRAGVRGCGRRRHRRSGSSAPSRRCWRGCPRRPASRSGRETGRRSGGQGRRPAAAGRTTSRMLSRPGSRIGKQRRDARLVGPDVPVLRVELVTPQDQPQAVRALPRARRQPPRPPGVCLRAGTARPARDGRPAAAWHGCPGTYKIRRTVGLGLDFLAGRHRRHSNEVPAHHGPRVRPGRVPRLLLQAARPAGTEADGERTRPLHAGVPRRSRRRAAGARRPAWN